MKKSLILSILVTCFLLSSISVSAGEWTANFGPTGVDGVVKAVVEWGDSTVIAGNINGLPGSSYSSEFVIYDNIDKSWHLVKNGPDGEIRALAVNDDGELILGGEFTFTYAGYTHTNIVKYDKNGNWSSLPGDVENGFFGAINALLWHDSSLYIGGEFLSAGGWPYKAFAVWNETDGFISPYPELAGFFNPDPVVYALSFSEAHGNKIYFGGEFVCPGDTSASLNVGRYDIATKQFEPFGLDVLGPVYSLYTNNDFYYQDKLVVGGEFQEVVTIFDHEGPPDPELCRNIIIFDVITNTYDSLNGGVNGPVYTFSKRGRGSSLDNFIYVGGGFDSTASELCGPLARWNQSTKTMTALDDGLSSGIVYDIQQIDFFSKFVIGGDFEYMADSSFINNVFSFKVTAPTEWIPLGDGLVNSNDLSRLTVNDVAVDSAGYAYVTGNFDYGGGVRLNHVGKWNKTVKRWEPLGDGLNGVGIKILVHNDTVYVAGFFTEASGLPVNHLAMWDGVQWSALGDGLPSPSIQDMEIDANGNLYVIGGGHVFPGTYLVPGVSMWNGSSWGPVGEPLVAGSPERAAAEESSAISLFDIYIDDETNDLYVCGNIVIFFATGGSLRSDGVVRWDGTKWNGFGEATYLTDYGQPLVITKSPEGDIIIGGNYDGAGIYEYTFGLWRPYKGTNVTNNATQMETIGCELFLAGDPISGIQGLARFNGFDWDYLDGGGRAGVFGFDSHERDLYVAGDFKLANGRLQGFSIWNGIPDPDADANLRIVAPTAADTLYYGTVKRISWDPNTTVENLLIEFSYDNGTNWSVINSRAKASQGYILWLIPDTISSTDCQLRIADASKPCITKVESDVFTIFENNDIDVTWLTRFKDGGGYQEPFLVKYQNWSFSNSRENMWPQSHVDTLYNPPLARGVMHPEKRTFPNWPLFSEAFGPDWTTINGDYEYPRPKVLLFFRGILNNWKGSCFGFSQTTLLWWIHNYYNTGIIIDDHFQFDHAVDDYFRRLINKHQVYQFGKKHIKYVAGVAFDKPMTTLRTIRSSIEDKMPRTVSFTWKGWELKEEGKTLAADSSKKGSGHNVVPYKIVTFPDTVGIYYMYVADPNFPESREQFLRIDSADQSWTYPNYPDIEFPKKLFPILPINEFIGTAMEDRVNKRNTNDDNIVFLSGLLEFTATDSVGNQIGSIDGEDLDTLVGAGPIYNLEPSFQDDIPIGFILPSGKYSMNLTDFNDSSMSFNYLNDSIGYSYTRTTNDSTQIDRVLVDSSFSFVNPDTAMKKISITSIDINSNSEYFIQLDSLAMMQNDSTVVGFDPTGAVKIENFGSAKDYSFLLWYAGSDTTDFTQSLAMINLPANSTQQIEPVWDNLGSGSVEIVIDNDQDGVFEDTISAGIATDISDEQGSLLPDQYHLAQNYPNPFNPITTISFNIPTRSNVKIEVLNILGQTIRTLIDQSMDVGQHSIEWDSKTDNGLSVGTGIYFYRLRTNDFVSTKKMLLLK